MCAEADVALVKEIASAKAIQAGVIRQALYERIEESFLFPLANTDFSRMSTLELTTGVAHYVSGELEKAGTKLVQPILDNTGLHLTNVNSEG